MMTQPLNCAAHNTWGMHICEKYFTARVHQMFVCTIGIHGHKICKQFLILIFHGFDKGNKLKERQILHLLLFVDCCATFTQHREGETNDQFWIISPIAKWRRGDEVQWWRGFSWSVIMQTTIINEGVHIKKLITIVWKK